MYNYFCTLPPVAPVTTRRVCERGIDRRRCVKRIDFVFVAHAPIADRLTLGSGARETCGLFDCGDGE